MFGMQFLSPDRLWFLLVIPVLVAACAAPTADSARRTSTCVAVAVRYRSRATRRKSSASPRFSSRIASERSLTYRSW